MQDRIQSEQDRIQREKDFHNVRFEKETRESLDKYYSVSQLINSHYKKVLFDAGKNKKVLEYGCGLGSHSFELAQFASEIYGIDISEIAIEKAEKFAKEKGISNIQFRVMNAEALNFENNFFDVVCGVSILHHLDLILSYSELSRVLKPGGKAFFIEPLGHNPIINLFRSLTSSLRTEDEHPLHMKDLDLLKKYFGKVVIKHYYLNSLLSVPFRNKIFFSRLLNFLDSIDQFLFKSKIIRAQSWQVVIEVSEPKK